MPNVKELQSIVDYTRSPDTSSSPAIDPVFKCSEFTNEAGKTDYPFYWSSTSHGGSNGMAGAAMYVAFGRAAGWMSSKALAGGPPERRGGGPQDRNGPPEISDGGSGDYNFVDVHGAGAQRSDPKAGDPKKFPHGRGPQGDAIRIFNYVRLVRGAK
jgi:hypothetical protein